MTESTEHGERVRAENDAQFAKETNAELRKLIRALEARLAEAEGALRRIADEQDPQAALNFKDAIAIAQAALPSEQARQEFYDRRLIPPSEQSGEQV